MYPSQNHKKTYKHFLRQINSFMCIKKIYFPGCKMKDETLGVEALSPEVASQPENGMNGAALPDSPSPPASSMASDQKMSVNEHPAYQTAMHEILALRQQVQQLEEADKGRALLQVQIDTLTLTVEQQAATIEEQKVRLKSVAEGVLN
jgi:hypothetical protein